MPCQRVGVKISCYVLKFLSGGSRVILEEVGREVGIFMIVSDLLSMMYFNMNLMGRPVGSIGRWIMGKYCRN